MVWALVCYGRVGFVDLKDRVVWFDWVIVGCLVGLGVYEARRGWWVAGWT